MGGAGSGMISWWHDNYVESFWLLHLERVAVLIFFWFYYIQQHLSLQLINMLAAWNCFVSLWKQSLENLVFARWFWKYKQLLLECSNNKSALQSFLTLITFWKKTLCILIHLVSLLTCRFNFKKNHVLYFLKKIVECLWKCYY